MRLIVAHRILVATFIAFSVFLALVKLRAWRGGGGAADLAVACASLLVAVGFGIYLGRLRSDPS